MVWTAAPRAAAGCAKVAAPIRHITSGQAVKGEITTVGFDLAKNVFSVHGVDAHGKTVLRKTLSRGKLIELMAQSCRSASSSWKPAPVFTSWSGAKGKT
jgi:hypothetical protein